MTAAAPPTSLTGALAEHVLALTPADVPSDVREQAGLLTLDALGAGLYGSALDAPGIVHAEAGERYREGEAQVWGHAERLVPAGAALVNATQAHAFELDDYHPGAKLHPGTVVVPAALAVLGSSTTRDELLTAIIAGYDVMVRLGLALDASATRTRGWHLTGLTGPFGAAAAAGRLLGLDRDALVRALGVAGSCSAGLFAFSREGSMTKRLHAGRAAEAGIVAVGLAARGFTGPSEVLEADDGGLLRAVSDASVAELATAELGTRFDLAAVAVKPYPCCGSIHSAIDCALAIRHEHAPDPADLAEVVVHAADVVRRQCGFPYQGDGGVLEAQMSMQYCVAAALLDGEVTPRQFAPERRGDPVLAELARRVTLELDPEIDRAYPARFAGRLTVRLHSGAELEHAVHVPSGSPGRCDRETVTAKFRGLTAGLLEVAAQDQLIELLTGDGGDIALRSEIEPHLRTQRLAGEGNSPHV